MLILCDENGAQTGEATWKQAHENPGKLHRAFSVYLFSPDLTEILIQRRSEKKPLWPRILANTCCSHPRIGQTELDIAPQRVMEECGITCPDLAAKDTIVYREQSPNGNGTEYEYVTLLVGTLSKDAPMNPNPDEVEQLTWISLEKLQQDMHDHPDHYAPWFPLGLHKVLS